MKNIFLAGLIMICLAPVPLWAQGCCGIGSLLVAGGTPTLSHGTLFIQAGPNYAMIDSPAGYKTDASLTIAYGITSRISVSVKSSYAWIHSKKFQPAVIYNDSVFSQSRTIISDNNDFGDGLLGAQLTLIPLTPLSKQELKTGADIGIPWAPDQKIQDNALLSKDMQTGSGAFTFGGFVSYSRAFPVQYLTVSSMAAGRLKFKNRRNESPGNEASALVSLSAGPFWITHESMSLNYKTSGTTVDVYGAKEVSTSGNRLDILPSITFELHEHVKALVEGEIPVWRDATQRKSGSSFGLRASVLAYIPVLSQ